MRKISARQICFFLAAIAPLGKLVVLPARLAEYAGNDLLLPAAIQFLLQGAAVFCVLLLAKQGRSLFELLRDTFGKVAAAALTLLLSLFMLYAAFLPLLEQKLFVQGVFYDTLPSIAAFSPFFLFSAYLCTRPLSSFGRTWDILAPVSIAGFAGILLFSATNADFGAIAPAGASGAKGILGGTAYSFSWFYDAALLLFLLGKIDYKKGLAWKGALCYLAGGAAVLLFLAVFYGIFEGTAVNQLFAFTKTSKYYSAITVLGRVDYLFIFALSLAMSFYAVLPLQAGIDGALQVFGEKKYLPVILSVAVNILFFALTVVLDYRFGEVMRAISRQAFWLFPVFTLLVPALCLLLRRRPHEKA